MRPHNIMCPLRRWSGGPTKTLRRHFRHGLSPVSQTPGDDTHGSELNIARKNSQMVTQTQNRCKLDIYPKFEGESSVLKEGRFSISAGGRRAAMYAIGQSTPIKFAGRLRKADYESRNVLFYPDDTIRLFGRMLESETPHCRLTAQ